MSGGAVASAAAVAAIRKKRLAEANAEPKAPFGIATYTKNLDTKRKYILTSDRDVTTYKNILPFQQNVKDFYDSTCIQVFVAGLILANFVVSACYKYYDPAADIPKYKDIFTPFEWFFGFAFLLELLINMYGSFFVYFWWGDVWAWNWFDFVIVVVSLLNLFLSDLPGISVCRLFRAFRVVRLFKRVPEMKKMVESILRALPAMGYAFCALVLLMGIWAIIGVEFLYDWPSLDSKQYGVYPEGYYFGDFWKAMLTLFQIMTFDSWASGIARDVIYDLPMMVVYFISFVFIGSIIMQNVLIAALLDVYLSGDNDDAEDNNYRDQMDQMDKNFEEGPKYTIELGKVHDAAGGGSVSSSSLVRQGSKYDHLSKREMLFKVLKRLDELEVSIQKGPEKPNAK